MSPAKFKKSRDTSSLRIRPRTILVNDAKLEAAVLAVITCSEFYPYYEWDGESGIEEAKVAAMNALLETE